MVAAGLSKDAAVDALAQRPAASLSLGTALGLICLPSLAFALGQLWLLAGGHIARGSAIVILTASACVSLLLARRVAGTWVASLAVATIVLLATLLSGLAIDTSYDGQRYHFDAITALAQGWNPYRTPTPTPDIVKLVGPLEAWVRHYPQGAWISSALQVAAGVPSEAAKNQALIVMAALFLAVFGAALEFGLGRLIALVAALMSAANPVLIVQLFSRMNDGLMGACFALVATFSALWLLRPRWWAPVGALCPLILALNLKFSAVPTAVGLCGLICLFALAMKGWRPTVRIAGGLALAGAVGVLVLGAHPYVTNTVREGHPFHPLMGKGKVDIMTVNRPAALQPLTPIQRIAASYFGATASGYDGGEGLKAPFTVRRGEFRAAGGYDTRFAGFGPLFSGALCLGAILAVAAWLQRSRPATVTPLLAGAMGMLGLALVMPEAWWARYTPQAWWAVVLLALAALVSRTGALRVGGGILAALLIADAGLVAASSAIQIGRANLQIRRQLTEIGREPDAVHLHLGTAHARLALLGDLARRVRLESEPLAGCRVIPLAGTSDQSKAGYCRHP